MGWFDVHAHLTDARLLAQEDALMARARAAGVTTILSNGLNPADNTAVAELAARQPEVHACFGLYPVDAVLVQMEAAGVDYPRQAPPVPADEAVAWVQAHVDDCVAVGEIGLDHHWVPEPFWAAQEQVFCTLVELAMAADKPIIVHTRRAELRAFELLKDLGAERVDWHCFSSRVKLGRRIAEHGHFLSITANARRAENFRRLLETLPRERVLLETDCPYLGPERGVLNEPANVVGTAALAAELWGCSLSAVKTQLESNFEALFGFAP